ncbi:hypothetical protein GGR57DRAFT_459067 [Xylariaceae sp. FL1272]|nr:hypothetical protein GGR57DRAFT_459067 [Xylariaceae sp. FL1272]
MLGLDTISSSFHTVVTVLVLLTQIQLLRCNSVIVLASSIVRSLGQFPVEALLRVLLVAILHQNPILDVHITKTMLKILAFLSTAIALTLAGPVPSDSSNLKQPVDLTAMHAAHRTKPYREGLDDPYLTFEMHADPAAILGD